MNTKRYDQEFFRKIFAACEQKGALQDVGPEHYEEFLKMSEKGIESTVSCLMLAQLDYTNKKILNGKWKTDRELYEFVAVFLEMMAQGIVGMEERDSKPTLVLFKPVGNPPDRNMQNKLDAKIKSAIPLVKRVMQRWLNRQETDSNK